MLHVAEWLIEESPEVQRADCLEEQCLLERVVLSFASAQGIRGEESQAIEVACSCSSRWSYCNTEGHYLKESYQRVTSRTTGPCWDRGCRKERSWNPEAKRPVDG